MKVARSYWLGLGSGLILSAMLTLVISPYQGQTSASKETVPNQPVKQQSSQSLTATGKSSDTAANDKPVSPQPSQVQPSQMTPPSPPSVDQTERDFVIPAGASADRIAELLVDQGFIKDKTSFLASAHNLKADSKFQSGTFTLTVGLTPEELIHRLLKN